MELNSLEQIKQFGIEKFVDKYNLRFKDYGHKFSLKYDQLNTPKNKYTNECRGLVLTKDLEVLSAPFYRFSNYSDTTRRIMDWDSVTYWEKTDGCCDEGTLLTTEKGERTIKEVCEDRDTKVLAFDIYNNEPVFTDIVDYCVKDNNDDWYEIEVEGGVFIKLTGNHKVWLPDLGCYRRVDEINEEDYVLLEKVD